MSLISTITSNPDFSALVGAGIAYLGRQVWKRAKTFKEGELWDTMLKIAYQAFPALFKDARLYDDDHVRDVISKKIWAGLARINVPRTPVIEALVAEVVEHAHGELAEKVFAFHAGNLGKPLEGTLETLKTLPQEVPVVTAS